MNSVKASISLLSFGAIIILFSSCGGGETEPEETASVDLKRVIEVVFDEKEPESPITVVEARKSAQPGDEVIVIGKVSGAMNPFTEGFATFVLADQALETCDLVPGDLCETPWDACCVEPSVIQNMRMSIQILGEDGRPVMQSLRGVRGMKELDTLVVSGTVAEESTADNLILNATGIFQKPSSPTQES